MKCCRPFPVPPPPTTPGPASLLKRCSLILLCLVLLQLNNPADGDGDTGSSDSGALQLKSSNFDSTIASTELVFINFYADWCHFNRLLGPIFNEAAVKVNQEFPDKSKVVFGRVDCDSEPSIAARYQVTKYPTLKLIRNGVPMKKEYRGSRKADAFVEYIRNELKDPMHEFTSLQELPELIDGSKRCFIGFLISKASPAYETFKKVASSLKDDCSFYVGFGDASKPAHLPARDAIAFHPDKTRSIESDEIFSGNPAIYEELFPWVQSTCIPLVREITFDNAEELTEEQLPLLILFHRPEDNNTLKLFKGLVQGELLDQRSTINFLHADGLKFAHPLHHLGKSAADLPLIAIDSFRHMYVFPDSKNMFTPGAVKRFIDKFHSGKLHLEFHYGPTGDDDEAASPGAAEGQANPNANNVIAPPESTFKHLTPSPNRYTLLVKEEL